MQLRQKLLTAALSALAPAWSPAAAAALPPAGVTAANGYNVVLISVDTFRPDHLGCYGYPRGTSPNIDRIAENGLVFDDYIAQGYLTPISMASMFSSLYPHRNGYTGFQSSPPADVRTLPEVFGIYGRKTAAFVSSPEFSLVPVNMKQAPHPFFSKGFDEYALSPEFRKTMTADILRWLQRNSGTSFFLWIAAGDTHWPYGVNAGTAALARFGTDAYNGPLNGNYGAWWDTHGRIYREVYYPQAAPPLQAARPVELTAQDKAYITGRYDAAAFETDLAIGAIESELKELGLDKNTLLVIHSIHADDFGEHGYYSHYDIYNTELRGALIMSGPGVRPGRAKAAVSGLDLTPTLLQYAGIPVFPQALGQSLLPVLQGEALPAPEYIFSERTPNWEQIFHQTSTYKASIPYAVRDYFSEARNMALRMAEDPAMSDVAVQAGGWKLIHRRSALLLPEFSWWAYVSGVPIEPPAEYELYDLEKDPLELTDLLRKGPFYRRDLFERLAWFEKDINRAGAPAPSMDPSAIQPYP
jgi:arylsulfatase A-like enzyme